MRCKDFNWFVSSDGKNAHSVQHAILATLMDIRDELKRINVRLDCHETLRIPRYLARIANSARGIREAVEGKTRPKRKRTP